MHNWLESTSIQQLLIICFQTGGLFTVVSQRRLFYFQCCLLIYDFVNEKKKKIKYFAWLDYSSEFSK